MMNVLKQLVFPVDSDTLAVYNYLQICCVSVTKTGLANILTEHPHSGTLLSVSDALTSLGVENVVASISSEKLEGFGMPFLARMKVGNGLALAVVKRFEDDAVIYLPAARGAALGQQRWVTTNKETFIAEFDGIILMGEAGRGTGQSDFSAEVVAENRKLYRTVAALAVLPILTIIAVAAAFIQFGWAATIPVIYTLFSFTGAAIGALLLWYEVDRHNPVFQQVCSSSRKVNCDAILQSRSSGIFGISFSLIGFSYFSGSLLILLTGGISNLALFSLLSISSLIAIGFTIFSLYYQWYIAKQWCKLCLWIQGILLAQAGLVVADGQLFADSPIEVSVPALLAFVVCFAVPFLVGLLIVPTFKKGKEGESHRRELSRMKHNPQIFQALLGKQKAITVPTEGLGVTLGNLDAEHRIIAVCNPYCGPCAEAHPVVEEILHHNPDVQLQIIFLASDDKQDRSAPPVRHLLTLAEKGDEILLKKALDDWYLLPSKDYEAFAARYPVNGELQTQGEKLTAMQTWCNKMEVNFTPTFFVDGYQLPDVYTVKDLKYFLRT